jgi:hypothetical protein
MLTIQQNYATYSNKSLLCNNHRTQNLEVNTNNSLSFTAKTCPKCGSEKTRRIFLREVDWFLFGYKEFLRICKNCGHRWKVRVET